MPQRIAATLNLCPSRQCRHVPELLYIGGQVEVVAKIPNESSCSDECDNGIDELATDNDENREIIYILKVVS